MMSTSEPTAPFTWLNVPPEAWPVRHAQMPQYCAICNKDIQGHKVTNARGSWEHFECAKEAYEYVHRKIEIRTGTQREFIDYVMKAGSPVTVDFDYNRPKTGRYRWWVA